LRISITICHHADAAVHGRDISPAAIKRMTLPQKAPSF
jgi:hypothetical protein